MNHGPETPALRAAEWFLRLALAASYLSAVADRFGMWGDPGSPGVAWGAWPPFMEYVSLLNGFAPAAMHPFLGITATVAEIVIAIGLVIGWKLRFFALSSGILLLVFAITMTLAAGVKSPLDYSVFTASAASFYLAAVISRAKIIVRPESSEDANV
ncbi:DoxX family protein [Rubinisphaera margarita]|uniref:DoxX family protein n=1 Tax=Rubinisphaera margarita TaxID=2909586 RepID=UPI001EE82D5C|nr:DoxX family protein [Rubinisphaera margarita]MCG6154822.1 DoxX family protein [Rubinisphaera margarita]